MESLGFDTPRGRGQGAVRVEGAVSSWRWEEGSQGRAAYAWTDPQRKVFKDRRGETDGRCLDRSQSHGQRGTEKETLGPEELELGQERAR